MEWVPVALQGMGVTASHHALWGGDPLRMNGFVVAEVLVGMCVSRDV